MVIGLIAATTLVATPRLALLELSPIDVPAERAAYATEQLGIALLNEGLVVTTPSDIRALLGLERQKQLLGCDEGASCLAELSGALGAGAIIAGQLAKNGERLRLSVKLLNATTGIATTAFTGEATDDPGLLEEISRCARHIARAITPPSTPGPLILGSAGAAAAAGGIAFLISSGIAWGALQGRGTETATFERARRASVDGPLHLGLGVGLLSLGVAAGAAALIWSRVSQQTTPAVFVIPTSSGLGIGGVW
jgi:hypothetical protein